MANLIFKIVIVMITKYYEANRQLKQLVEVAISKLQRSGQSLGVRRKIPSTELSAVIEEMADVENIIEQIKFDLEE